MTDPAVNIPLAMLIVFGTAKVLAEVFERLHQPAIVGEILAGVLVGPSVLAWIAPNDVLSAFAQLGVMFLLFRVGLEVKSAELMKVGIVATFVAVAGVVLPFLAGWGIMTLWGSGRVEAVFVGAAMVATSVGITAQVLGAKGLLHHRASQVILTAAVIDDILGLLVLAVVSGMARRHVNPWELALTAVLAIGFTAVVAFWGTATVQRFIPHVVNNLRAGERRFNVALLLLFSLSLLATYAGVAAIIGAFLAGMAMSESVGERVHDLTNGITELLVPFFLAGIGLHLDLASLNHPSTLLLTGLIFAAAALTKFIGCGLGAIKLGWDDSVRVGIGMIPRGEVGMVVAQLGLSMGVIPKDVYGVVVTMAIATTLVAPPLLNLSFRKLQPGAPVEEFQLG